MSVYERADEQVIGQMRKMLGAYHPALRDAGVSVDVIFAKAKTDEHGQPVGPAIKKRGVILNGYIRILGLKDRVMGRGDAEMVLDGDRWPEWSSATTTSLPNRRPTRSALRPCFMRPLYTPEKSFGGGRVSNVLAISKELSLPLDAVTQAIGWLGRRGSGKSYGATKLAELFWEHGAQFVAVDPVGIWYGLRLSHDGKGKGIDVPIFGGLHGDVPIQAGGGALLADVIVDRDLSAVLDVSQFESDADKARFARDFAARFFYRKKASPSAVHLFVEECQEFIPQNVQKGEEQMLHAFQRTVRLGRNYGIGVSMISQRPQDVNKKALNQTECLFCFQLTGPQERKAVEGWVSDKGLDEDLGRVLPGLKVGNAHVWSPVWLNVNKEVRIAQKTTFPAGSTPKVGAKPVRTKPLEPLELEQLHRDMAATIERAKATDPKHLQRRVRELEGELARASAAAAAKPAPKVEQKRVEVLVVKDQQIERLQAAADRVTDALEKVESHRSVLGSIAAGMQEAIRVASTLNGQPASAGAVPVAPAAPPRPAVRAPTPPPRDLPRGTPAADPSELPAVKKGARKILQVLCQWHPRRLERDNLAFLSGFAAGGGTYGDYLSILRRHGFLDEAGGTVGPTKAAFDFLAGDVPARPATPRQFLDNVRPLLKAGAVKMAEYVLAKGPDAVVSRQELGDATGFAVAGGTFGDYLSLCRRAGVVVDADAGGVKANPIIFEG